MIVICLMMKMINTELFIEAEVRIRESSNLGDQRVTLAD